MLRELCAADLTAKAGRLRIRRVTSVKKAMKHFLTAGLMLGILVLAACAPTRSTVQAAGAAPPDNRQYVYVCNQSDPSVSIIDVETLELVSTVDLGALGFDKNAKPHHIAVEPDGSFWYVSLIGAGKVLKFNYENELVGQADFEAPGMLALHPTEDLLFVGRSMMAVNPPQRIGMIERSTMEIEELDVFFPRPHALAIHPGGEYVFSASLAVNQFLSMNIESGEIKPFQRGWRHPHLRPVRALAGRKHDGRWRRTYRTGIHF